MQLPRIDAHLSPSHFLTFSLSHFLLHHSNTSDGRRPSLVGRRSRQCRHSGDQRETGIRRRGKDFTTKAQRTQRGKDASHKRQGHGEKRAVVCGLSVLALGHPQFAWCAATKERCSPQRARRKANRLEDKKKAPRGFGPSVASEPADTEETEDTKKGANGNKGDL
jgi:hypothetical protein